MLYKPTLIALRLIKAYEILVEAKSLVDIETLMNTLNFAQLSAYLASVHFMCKINPSLLFLRTHLYQPFFSQCSLSLPPENIRKLSGFLMFSGDREKVHWE